MDDQRSRGGKKTDRANPPVPDDQQLASANQSRPENAIPAGQGLHPKNRPADDESEAPESGPREPPDGA